ncbi:WbqC family protein [Candidatus Hydrogenedentota bacterium]
MIVTIHQPNFLPWLGFFHKMAQTDVMVLLDIVPFTKGGYQNRASVASPQGEKWLTVPVLTRGRQGQSTASVEINNTAPWRKKIVSSLKQWYADAPGMETAAPLIDIISQDGWERLTDLNIRLLEEMKDILGIETQLVKASEMNVSGTRSELLANICRDLKADIYLSGPSGRDYLDHECFGNVNVMFHKFEHPEYNQLYGRFIPGLSAIDLLMNTGRDARTVLFGASKEA